MELASLYLSPSLTSLCSASWLAICHYESLCCISLSDVIHDEDKLKLLHVTEFRNHHEIENAVAGIATNIERLHRMSLHRWLPSTVVACIVTPMLLTTLGVKLFTLQPPPPSTVPNPDLVKRYGALVALTSSMRILSEHHDNLELAVGSVRRILDQLEIDQLTPFDERGFAGNLGWKDVLRLDPSLYLRLVTTIDLTLGNERFPSEDDFPDRLQYILGSGVTPLAGVIGLDHVPWKAASLLPCS